MEETIKVFDLKTACFRELKTTNGYSDIGVGILFFARNAIDVIKKHYRICGYTFFNECGLFYSIDIQKDKIVLLEEVFLEIDNAVQRELLKYNVIEKPKEYMTRFFWDWQFEGKMNAFDSHGPFYKLCHSILKDSIKTKKLATEKNDIVPPIIYKELCQFARIIGRLFDTDFYNKDYSEEANYVLNSLLNGYRIEMSANDIDQYCLIICGLICKTEATNSYE